MSQKEVSRKEAIELLWHRGSLIWKLHPPQKKMYEDIMSSGREQTVIASSRRFGKSHLMCLLAAETCLKIPGAIVKYVCPRQRQVKTIIKPIMTKIFQDCPPELKPDYKTNDLMYLFPNGSQIQLAGTDNGHHESLRGGFAHLCIIDEAGTCSDLTYVVNTILAPTTDTTDGKVIVASTPSPQFDHEFNEEFMRVSEYKGELLKYTIYDNPMMTPEKIEKIISRYKLRDKDPEFRREYLCEIVVDTESSVVPEFSEAAIVEHPKPPFYDSYTSMDIGGRDFTVVLFAYYDFRSGTIVIEDEHVISNSSQMRTDKLADAINLKEQTLWTNIITGEFKPPLIRVADNNNLILLNDLDYDHNIRFVPTRKDNKDAAINKVRLKVASGELLIHPRCKTLIYHVRNAMWDKAKQEFAKSPDGGHYDALDALIYLVRNIDERRNPYPDNYGMGNMADMFINPYAKKDQYDHLRNIFTPRSSLKKNNK